MTPSIDDESNQEKYLVYISGLIVQMVCEMKTEVAQNPKFPPSISTRVEIVKTQLEIFFKEQKLPPPEIPPVPQASHPLQFQLNKILGFVSMICKLYQLQPGSTSTKIYNQFLKEVYQKIINTDS